MGKASIRTGLQSSTAESPSAQIARPQAKIEYETDALNRRIGVKKASTLEKYRLSKIMGSDSNNPVRFGYAILTLCVHSIDNELMQAPNSDREIEIMLGRLGDEGCDAIGKCLIEKFGIQAPTEEVQEQIKN